MATTIWHGHLTFGLVSIPVRLFKAARSEKIRFHQLYKPGPALRPPETITPQREALEPEPATTGRFDRTPVTEVPPPHVEQYTRIRQNVYVPPDPGRPEDMERRGEQPWAASAPKTIARSELVKGYEYDKNHYVVVESEDLEKITPQTATEMEILEFVKLEEIDPVYFETSYYMAPDEAGEKAYALLFQAMRETRFVALAEVAMRRREHVMILRPGQQGLLAHTMFYADEIRQDREHHADPGLVGERELKMAKLLVESLAAPFEPGKYKDKFREKLQGLIAARLEGRQVAQVPAAREPAEVVDILHALEKSLKLVRKPAESAASRKPRQRRAGG